MLEALSRARAIDSAKPPCGGGGVVFCTAAQQGGEKFIGAVGSGERGEGRE